MKMKKKDILATDVKLQSQVMPNVANFVSVAEYSNKMFDWDLSDYEIQDHKKTYGFVYKCIADNTSNPNEWLNFDSAIGRNVVAAIFNHHESHLITGVITIMYPENGMSPNAQSAFISMLVNHPQAKHVTELRIVTRSAWFISDCKSVRVLQIEHTTSNQEESKYYVPATLEKTSRKDRLKILRTDPYFDKKKKAIFLNFAKSEKDQIGIYLGEDDTFVYWTNLSNSSTLLRTDHYNFWYKLNAVLLTNEQCDEILPLIEKGATHNEMRDFLRKFEH